MIKKHPLGYTGMSQDMSKSKTDNSKYFSASNIRLLATDSQTSYALVNEKGNKHTFTIPSVTIIPSKTRFEYTNVDGTPSSGLKFFSYKKETNVSPGCELENNYTPNGENSATSGTQIIIGTADTRGGSVIVTTDNNGWDCIWEFNNIESEDNYTLDLIYVNSLNLSSSSLVQILYNYENSIIEKIYMADGVNQLRYMNIRQSIDNGDLISLADMRSTSIDIVGKFDLSSPEILSVISGGSHESGRIQYAYNLYILNGAQTVISPISELVSLTKGDDLGGGALNESLGKTVIVNVNNIDKGYTHIKLYAIKYTSYNQSPSISLIADRELSDYDSFSYYDDGSIDSSLSTEEFVFLGSNPSIPKHITSKDSRLFSINIKEQFFDVDLDARCYGHNVVGAAVIWDNVSFVTSLTGDSLTIDTNTYAVPEKHDSINRDYSVYTRVRDGSFRGAEGKYFQIIVDQSEITDGSEDSNQYLKDNDIYRFGIEFYNELGQKSTPKWLCDIQAPEGNLQGNYNRVIFSVKQEFLDWIDNTTFEKNQQPVGYRVLRADRTLADRTILTQGIINPMILNERVPDNSKSYEDLRFESNTSKMPSILRTFNATWPFAGVQNEDSEGVPLQEDNDGRSLGRNKNGGYNTSLKYVESVERQNLYSSEIRANSWQFNRMMQMFSPEVMFTDVDIDSSYKLSIVGMVQKTDLQSWQAEYSIPSKSNIIAAKFENGINKITNFPNTTTIPITGNPEGINDISFWGPTNADNAVNVSQMYREFNIFDKNNITSEFEIYGTPEISGRGADFKNYNNDASFRYSNHLLSFLQDNYQNIAGQNNDTDQQVFGANSLGSKCITFVEGSDDSNSDPSGRRTLYDIKTSTSFGNEVVDGVLLGEFVKSSEYKYVGNIYGGSSYEAKSVTNYIPIGEYANIATDPFIHISSPGDTFVQQFTFQKLSRTDNELTDNKYNQVTEIVSFKVETTIDLKNRNDFSLKSWDNKWQPAYTQFHEYNNVYSQQDTLIVNTDPGFKFKQVKDFDTRILSSNVKNPGENIDSWTDFLENETMDLDGKYGPINAIAMVRDELYTLQTNGVAKIRINPRVQVTSSDSSLLELGTGGILHDYDYITTKFGSINKWSVQETGSGFYFYDTGHKSLMLFNGQLGSISDSQGMHSFFERETNFESLIVDNSLLGNGISTGYNSLTGDVYFTFKQDSFYLGSGVDAPDYSNDFTICYNEKTASFTAFYDYKPSWYINKGSVMVTIDPTNNQAWKHGKGANGSFYGQVYDSSIDFSISIPQGSGNYTFNNLSYNMEMKDEYGRDLLNETFSHVTLDNDYQRTAKTPIVIRGNSRRKNRKWSLTLPRELGTRNKIKSPWVNMKLELDNSNDYDMVAHDLIVSYTES